MKYRIRRISSILLSFIITFSMIVTMIPSFCYEAYAASNKLQLVGTPTVYVQSGGEAYFTVEVKNISGGLLKGVNVAHGFGSMDDYYAYANGESYEYRDGFSEMTTQNPRYDEPDTWYRFTRAFEDGQHQAEHAVWDSKEEGYTIKAGETATLWFRVNSEYEDPGTYTDGWVVFGDIHSELVGGFMPVPVVDSTYTGHCNIKVITYNPSAAAITLGTKASAYGDITPVALGSTLDFGTINLANSTGLKTEKTYYTRNTTTISNTGKDEHGHTQSISVELSVESTDENDCYLLNSPFGCNTHLGNGQNWSPLEPVKPNEFMEAQTGITLNAGDFVAGTYTAKFRLLTNPHGVKVNGSAIHTNGVYEWPVTVKLTGTNPRIPKAPQNVSVSPGNGLVEISWKPAANAEEGLMYQVWRRDGKETGAANLSNAAFDWSKYEYVGEDAADENGNCLLVDGTVENGKTYTYIVIGGDPLRAYPAISGTVKPDSGKPLKIQAPSDVYGDEQAGGVLVQWYMNENYGGRQNDGSTMVDHFNIYRDGVLVAQVNQSAVIEDNWYDWYLDGDTYKYGITNTTYGWECFVETPVAYQNYMWSVSAVSKSGVEGYISDGTPAQGCDAEACIITGHQAYATLEDGSSAYVTFGLKYATMSSPEKVEYWRSTGDNPPDTSGAPLFTKTDLEYDVNTEFVDNNVVRNKKYTYTARLTDSEGNVSKPYTFSVFVPKSLNWSEKYYNSTDVEWSVSGNNKANMKWYADYEYDDDGDLHYFGTYKVYRNDQVIATYTASGQNAGSFNYSNDPGSDGTYIYRVDKTVNGVTIRGRDYTFVRNTAEVDESALLKAPEAPIFDVRISEGKPVLRWAASESGSPVEGYNIYRTDGGKQVNGQYLFVSANEVSQYLAHWPNMRYITIKDPAPGTLVDQYGSYKGSDRNGVLDGLSWDEEDCPHEYWITAYNQAGESAPSKVVTFDFQGTHGDGSADPPENTAEQIPAAPEIDKVWVDWEDYSDESTNWDDAIGGRLRVSWEDAPGSVSDIDKWNASFTGIHSEDNETLYSWQAADDPGSKKGKGIYAPSAYVSADSDDYGNTASVTVTAQNSAGSAASEAKTLLITSFPRFRAIAGSGKVKLQWTDLFEDTTTTVNSWEIWRKRASAKWEKIDTLNASQLDYEKDGSGNYITDYRGVKNYAYSDTGVTNGWEYEYKVVAVCGDGIDRASVVRTVKPLANASSEAPGAPQNLSAEIVNGEIVFTWDPPAEGDAQHYQLVYEDTHNGEKYWTESVSVHAPSTSMVWQYYQPGTFRFFVYAYSYINGQQVPDGVAPYESDDIDEVWPNHSNIVTVELKQSDINAQATSYPGDFTVTATSGTGQITLNWTPSSGATYYELRRYDTEWNDDFNTLTLPRNATSYTDTSALPGVRYCYQLTAYNYYGSNRSDVYAVAEGVSHDDIIAGETADQIDQLPDPETINDGNIDTYREAINDANESFQALTDKQKKKISDAQKQKLNGCVDKLQEIDLLRQYGEVTAPVIDMINALPEADSITLDDKADVVAAREAFDDLPSEAKKLLKSEKSKLTAAEEKIRALEKAEADRAVVQEILDDIDALASYSDVNESNASDVLSAADVIQRKINALDADQRALLYSDDNTEALAKFSDTTNMAKGVSGQPHEHLMQTVGAVAPTCSETGNIKHYKCIACGKLFADEDGVTEITAEETVVPVDPAAHSWGEWVDDPVATCSHEGFRKRVCLNDSSHTESVTVGRQKHDWDTDDPVSTETSADGKTITEVQKCKNCDETRTVVITLSDPDACGGNHEWDLDDPVEVMAATCIEDGYTKYKCKNCAGTIMEVEEKDPTKHGYGEWQYDPEPTCTESGKRVRICSHDPSHREEEIVEALGHDWGDGEITTEPSCGRAGIKTYTCKRCGKTKTEILPADPSKHDWGEWHYLYEPTCTATGQRMHECETDPSHFEIEDVPPLGHTWDGGVVTKKATLKQTGIKTYTCTVCGEKKTETIAKLKLVTKTDLPAVAITKPKAGKKSVTVKWKKVSKKNQKKIKGIEIQVATDSKFKHIVKKTTAGKAKTSKVVKGLKSKKKYWIRIRAYKQVGNVKHVSKWKVKTIKVK